jgi:hypothetical protein
LADQGTDKNKPSLLLSEEEWMAKNKSHIVILVSSSSGGKGGNHYAKKNKAGARNGGSKNDHDRRDAGCHPSSSTPRRNGRCKKCGVFGHWAKECLNKKPAKEDPE